MDADMIADRRMAETVKQARASLQVALMAGLRASGSSLRLANAKVFEVIDPDGTRLSTLADRAGISHQAMSELVAELIGTGHLERIPDPTDGRAKLIRPTADGRAELGRGAVYLREIRHRWQARLGNDTTVDEVLANLAELVAVCDEMTATTTA